MPPRTRRKAPPPASKATTTASKRAKTKDDEISLSEVYQMCRNADPSQIRLYEEQGMLSRRVWPTLISISHNNNNNNNNNKIKVVSSQKKDEWKEACHLLALLISSAVEKKDPMEFIGETNDDSEHDDNDTTMAADSVAVLTKVFQTLLVNEFLDEPEILHLITVALASDLQLVKTALQPFLPSIAVWHFAPSRRRELELRKNAGWRRNFATMPESPPEMEWLVIWVSRMLALLERKQTTESMERDDVAGDEDSNDDNVDDSKEEVNDQANVGLRSAKESAWLHRSLDLLIDLLSSVSTRQHLVPYLDAIHFDVKSRFVSSQDNLTAQLLRRVYRLLAFPIQGKTPLSKSDVISMYHARATTLQKICHRHYSEQLPEVIYAGVGLICNGSYLKRALGGLKDDQLNDLVYRLRLIERQKDGTREFSLAVLMHHVTIPPYPLDQLKALPLYPTEHILWDHDMIPPGFVSGNAILSLPKLRTQFLSYQDYLLRNFELIRLESAYEIRSDLVDAIKRVKPVVRQSTDEENVDSITTDFRGWARMALELQETIRMVKVAPPKLGEYHPAEVIAEFTIDLVHCGNDIRREWDGLGEFDNIFLVTVDATQMTGAPAPLVSEVRGGAMDSQRRVPDEEDSTFPERFGIIAVRGCMILQIRDEEGRILSDPANQNQENIGKTQGTKRVLRVALDPAQFAMDARSKVGTRVYESLNLVVRRHGRENNFKAVLETIRGLMDGSGSINRAIPSWLQPLLLGYGDPNSASYKSEAIKAYALKTPGVSKPDAPLDYGDTFLDEEHLRSSFPGSRVVVDGRDSLEANDVRTRHNYRVRVSNVDASTSGDASQIVEAVSYAFPQGVIGNPVRFTPVQVEAVRSGLSLGLTVVVGPPGTGKTDVAVQIIGNLYHSFPTQRTVIITHSNAALNDLFTKVMARGDLDERYLLRLGSGERELNIESSHDFTKTGRVNHTLARRAALLEKVQLLSESLGVSGKAERGADGSPSYTCETAQYFNKHHVQKHVKEFQRQVEESKTADTNADIGSLFPFKIYFNMDTKNDMTLEEASTKLSEVDDIFAELSEYRPLELLRSQRQRTDYLLMKQARVVAMTCTHAAIARSHLIELGFQYDNLVMEEAGQMMEVETFIPLLLQRGETDEVASALSRLKRICLIGDHHQLPPVVKNMSFSKFSNLDQSLFSRLIRLGVPYIQLNRQGRARSDIAGLYSWRYKDLGNLDHVLQSPAFQVANTGFAHTFQMINIEDFQGRGESAPTAYFYQNVGEAEYAVALFQYMVLIGYPPASISILTTYNGQKDLLLDILSQRCGEGTPFAGLRPKAVSTVDQYQGQQNDFVILSLVRTSTVGHLRDVRRLVVAVSRARLGLYVVCRQNLFATCHELRRTMDRFVARPNKLQLVIGEHFPTGRKVNDSIPKKNLFEVEDVAHLGAMVHSMQEQWCSTSTQS